MVAKTVPLVNLEYLLELLCKKKKFTKGEANNLLKSLLSREKLSKDLLDGYLRVARDAQLVEQISRIYYRTLYGNEICDFKNKKNKKEVKKLLHLRLQNIPAYSDFIDFIKENKQGRSKDELNKKPNPVSANAMIAWGEWLGVIKSVGETYWYLQYPKIPSLEEFWSVLVEEYDKLTNEFFGVKRYYPKIPELRQKVAQRLTMDPLEFDKKLKEVIKNKKYFGKIELVGAPASFIENLEKKGYHPFDLNGKIYIYIAITKF